MSEDILFEECLEALNSDVAVLSKKESDKIWTLFKQNLPILFWGRIDWDKIDKKRFINVPIQINEALEQLAEKSLNQSIYILWNDASVPIIKTTLRSAVNCIDDITCVGPDTWFLNINDGYIVEFFHEDINNIGVGLYNFLVK